jgi:multidrug resistance efflux pump
VIAAGAALTVAALQFRRSAAAPSTPPPAAAPARGVSDAVVCFGTVDLERGVAALGPIQPGRVAEVLVAENQAVAGGAELIRLEDGADRGRLAEAEAAVELAREQLRQARKQPDLHRSRVAQQRAMRDSMHSRVSYARRALAHEQKLAKSVVVAETDRSISEEKVRELEALEEAETHRLAELEDQDVEAGIRRAEWELKGAEARREQAKQALDDRRIRAPRSGTVLRILAAPGDVLGLGPGQPAVLFAADGPQVIRATVEQEFAGRIKEGEPALVHDEAEPSITWRGRVSRLAGWYSQRRTVLHDPSQLSDVRTLECLVLLDPGQPPLRLGQSVRVVIGAPAGPGKDVPASQSGSTAPRSD